MSFAFRHGHIFLSLIALIGLTLGCRAEPTYEPDPPATHAVAPEVPVAPDPPDAREEAMRRAELLVRRAMEEAAEGIEVVEGVSACERAFQEATQMMRTMIERGAISGGMGPPRREAFMQACARLPEASRRCIAPSYSLSHPEECRRARESLDPELQREVRGLMNRAF